METHEKLREWAVSMGYQCRIPASLQRICNPSTAIIWEQLIAKTKPRQEVQRVKNNILINRLKRDNSSFPHLYVNQSDYPIKEKEVWDKNVILKQQIDTAQYRIDELNSTLTDIEKQNKIKYINLDHHKTKVHEHLQFKFLLDSKAKQLETQIIETEELLKQVRNSTPIETMEQNDEDIVNTLKMCSDKLCKIIEQQKDNNISTLPETSITTVYSKEIFDESLGILEDSISFTDAATSSFISPSNFCNYNLGILNDDILHQALRNLLHSKDRGIIWNIIYRFSEMFKMDLINAVAEIDKIDSSCIKKDHKEECKLYALHVQYELKTRKCHCEIEILKEKLHQLSESFKNSHSEYSQNQLQLYLKKIALNSAEQHMQVLISKIQTSLTVKNDLKSANEKASAIQDAIERTFNDIKQKSTIYEEVLEVLFQTQSKISIAMKQIAPFTLDLNWSMPLYSCLNSSEIQTALAFPLEFNRVTLQNGVKKPLRDISMNHIPYEIDLDSNTIHMLIATLKNPFMPTELMLLNMFKKALKMKEYKALELAPYTYMNSTCTADEFQLQDSYLNYNIDKLKSFISANSAKTAGATLRELKSTISLWLETSTKSFISNEELYKGLPYEYYEQLFNGYYIQL